MKTKYKVPDNSLSRSYQTVSVFQKTLSKKTLRVLKNYYSLTLT